MKIKYDTLKTSVMGTVAATLMAVSAHSSAADYSHLLWAGHFKEAYSGAPQQRDGTTSRSNTSSRVQNAPIWAGQFERAYGPPSARAGVVTGPGHRDIAGRLLWAGNFKQAYQPTHEEVLSESGNLEVAMDR